VVISRCHAGSAESGDGIRGVLVDDAMQLPGAIAQWWNEDRANNADDLRGDVGTSRKRMGAENEQGTRHWAAERRHDLVEVGRQLVPPAAKCASCSRGQRFRPGRSGLQEHEGPVPGHMLM